MRIFSALLPLLLLGTALTAQAPVLQAYGTLLDLMRGALYSIQNTIFKSGVEDPESPPDDPLGSDPFGGWTV